MKKGIVFLFFGLILCTEIYGQDFCAQKLSEAEDKFEQGRFYEIPDILSMCLNSGFTKEERVRAYRILTITYLYLDNKSKADESYLALLHLSPEYKVNPEVDPTELINHHQRFTTRPFVYLTVKGGANLSHYLQLQDYSLTSENKGAEKVFSALGYNFNLGAEIFLRGNLNLGIEGGFTMKSFDYTNFQLNEINGDKGLETNMRQVYATVDLPVYLKQTFGRQKVSPFILGGVAPFWMIMANSVNQTGSVIGEQITRDYPNYEITDYRRKFNYSLLGGAGLRYKLGINYLTIEVRYHMTMLNYVDKNRRFDASPGVGESYRFGLLYVDDDFKLNNLSVMFGFTYPLYKPRKIAD